MRKILLSISFIFFAILSNAQEQKAGVKLNVAAASGTYSATFVVGNPGFVTLNVGVPLMGVIETNVNAYTYTNTRKIDIGFPWGEYLVNKTFSRDEFTVSKGYFSDRIELNWRIMNNAQNITNFQIYRTDDINSVSPNWGNPLSTLANNATTYIDQTAEGGKLYRYKVKVIGTNSLAGAESDLTNYIIGIGYRNPTGIVTGSITFKGGNPVQNVLVSAVAEGGDSQFGRSVYVPSNGYIGVPNINTPLSDSFTIQVWHKKDAIDAGAARITKIFDLLSNSGEVLSATAQIAGNTLSVTVGSSTFVMQGQIPTGNINNKGDDIFTNISSLETDFLHFSIVLKDGQKPLLYINGRPMTATYYTYVASVTGVTTNTLNVSGVSVININTSPNGIRRNWNSINFGGLNNSYVDDIRVFNKNLSDEDIKVNYRRYLRGDETGLTIYLRMDEAAGQSAYDLSFKGAAFNGNDANFYQSVVSNWVWWNIATPRKDQLGIFGITNSNGSYSIAAIPYKGSGELFKITPSLGVHKFNPTQESVFIGTASSIVNRLNFIDESAFAFKGRALFDSRGVFPYTTDAAITGDIHDNEAYNAYVVGDLKYPKGEYWAEYGTGVDANRIVRLRRYAPIAVEGAYVYVDNQIVLDDNNNPVVTDENGRFSIQVPIGKHSVAVKKTSHNFLYDGRFPANTTVTTNGITKEVATFYDFFEDNNAEFTFIDTTKVTVVGRVVGGQKELNKPIGFGFEGVYKVDKPVKSGATPEQIEVSSVNNMGTAQITLGFRQPNVTGALQNAFKTNFYTNAATGEYKVKLLPLRYELNSTDVYISSQQLSTMQRFLRENQVLNFNEIPAMITSAATYTDSLNNVDTLARSLPYHYVKNIGYMATPQVSLIEQLSETKLKVGDSTYTIANSFTTPIYNQLSDYSIKFQRQERYYNYEKNPSLFIVPATQGNLSITNNFAYPGSENIETDSSDASKLIYTFKVGTANTDISQNFTNTISANYILNGVSTSIPGVKNTAIVLGGAPDGSRSFTTQGPDKIDFILRDPPGSGSSATLEKGSSLSLSTGNEYVYNSTMKMDFLVSSGVNFFSGVGVVIPTTATNEAGLRVNINMGTTDGKSLNTTYSFGQSISTSSSSDITGAAADIYIGNSTNYFYGLYDNLAITETEKFNSNHVSQSIPISTTSGTKYISKNKAIYYSPNGTSTAFAFSQNYIITELIPKYELILNGLRNGTLVPNNDNQLKDSTWYIGSINAWKEAIFRNEARKYLVYSQITRDSLSKTIKNDLTKQYTIAGSMSTIGKHVLDMFDKTYYKNLSIDSKVGSYGESLEIANTTSYVTNFTLGLGLGALLEQEAEINGNGIHFKMENENISTYNYSQQQDISSTTNVSYVLSDPDPLNVLSVDVINSFDGNGPIFIRKGGISSCPAEPADSTYYFNKSLLPKFKNSLYSADSTHYETLSGSNREEISGGSIFVEKPVITVQNNTQYGVPETGKAQFTLTLRNASSLEPPSSSFVLNVNPATNPHGAKFNISPHGTPISLNGSTAIQYTLFMEKGAADVFDYENIEIDFGSICDGNINSSVLVSAHFIQSCTKVEVASPSNNWAVNYTTSHSNGSTIALPIVLNGFTTNYSGFKRIALQYRTQGSPSWTILKNYVVDNTAKTDLIAQGYEAALIEVISGIELNYSWDVARLKLSDGNYEIRAVSYCANGTIFETAPVVGRVDLNPPVLFGTPTPTNGILSIGDDLKIKFNEAIKKAGSLTRTEIVIQQNQLPVDHSVALSFSAPTNQATIEQPFLKAGNLSIEFWLRNGSTASGSTIISQANGFNISVSSNTMTFAVGNQSITGDIFNDGAYHHYALTYDAINGRFSIIQDDAVVKSDVKATNLLIDNNSKIVFGGSNFVGKIHDLRFWNNIISRETAVANMYSSLVGNEDGLIGNWSMGEGHGLLAKDNARSKNIVLNNVNWDIFPNTQSYDFDGTNYLTLGNASKSIFSSTMDGTIEFWFKTSSSTPSTILSNGKGDLSDDTTSSGFRNKWSFDLDANGVLKLKAENLSFAFGSSNLADGNWHHAAVVLKRKGNLTTYVDGVQTNNYPVQGLGGFSNAVLYVGARGQVTNASPLTIDQKFTGQIDDIRVWNMARQSTQVAEDMYYEQDYLTTGLVLYAPLNSPAQANQNGPKYYYPINAFDKVSDYALLNSGSVLKYSSITPAIKPIRNRDFLVVNSVINNDEMILNPAITKWASVEKKIAYITVANISDMTDNLQESPVTWSAYINKNPLKWYIDGYDNNLNVTLDQGKTDTYQLVIANVGGDYQSFNFDLPSYLSAKTTSGIIAPNSQQKIAITVNTSLSPGKYFDQLRLHSNYGYVEQIQANVRILSPEPVWGFDPNQFEENMNIIGKIKVNGVLSTDIYSKVIAYHLDTVKGIAPLVYDPKYDSYYVMLSVYGNAENAGDQITYKIWDATDGVLKSASINGANYTIFQPNDVLGDYKKPIIFENTNSQTQILTLNPGWTWVSFNVNDSRFNNLNEFFKTTPLTKGDMVKSYNPTYFDVYNVSSVIGQTGWFGTVSLNGGIDPLKSYRIKLANGQKVLATGSALDINSSINLTQNWNNLPYIPYRNLPINEALSSLDAQDGDQVKSQSQFAIYDGVSKSWKGNLTYMTSGQGYMIKTSKAQVFKYPSYSNNNAITSTNGLNNGSIVTNATSGVQKSMISINDGVVLGSNLVNSYIEQPVLQPHLLKMGETMNMVATLPAGYTDVQFYVNGSKEPISSVQKVTLNGSEYSFITLYSDTVASIKAVLSNGSQTAIAEKTIAFASNTTLGTLSEPYTFTIKEPIVSGLNAYPNPFDNEVSVEFNVDANGVAYVQLFDIESRMLDSKKISVTKGVNRYHYTPISTAAGSYTIRVVVGDHIYTKILVKQ